jgi:hypothetical protein
MLFRLEKLVKQSRRINALCSLSRVLEEILFELQYPTDQPLLV